jgi:hypothetical protein
MTEFKKRQQEQRLMEDSPSDQPAATEGETSTSTFTPESPRQSFKTLEQYKPVDFSQEDVETAKEEPRREESLDAPESWNPEQSNSDSDEKLETEKEEPRYEENLDNPENWAQSQSDADSGEELETGKEESLHEESLDDPESWDPEQSNPDSDEEKFEEQSE